MKKHDSVFFIVPGFKEQATEKQYRWLISYIKKSGWNVVTVPVQWNNRTLSQNAADFTSFYNQHKGTTNYILGFSYGAVITLLSTESIQPTKIYLCSLSPDFKEDSDAMSEWIKKYIGKKRFQDIQTRSALKISQKLSINTTIFYGGAEGEEFPSLKKRCEETAKLAKEAKLVVIPNAPHKIDYPEYQISILKELDLI